VKCTEGTTKNGFSYRWVGIAAASVLAVALSGCGGSAGGDGATPSAGDATTTTTTTTTATGAGTATVATPAVAAAAITTATAVAANDTATNASGAFAVVAAAGVPPVSINSPPKVSFTVISDGAVVKGLTTSNARVVLSKLVPGTNGAPDQWVSYVSRTETAKSTVGPGGKAALTTASQSIYDPAAGASQLAYSDAGYYTYTFTTDIKDKTKTNGVEFDAKATHRVTMWLNYKNKAGKTVYANPYFDFTVDANGNAVAVTDSTKTRKVVDISSCNECHSALGLHGGNAVDTNSCVVCHNAGLTDANSGNNLDFRTMIHKIHAGEKLKELFNVSYAVWGYADTMADFSEVTYPQPLTNCVKCHDGAKKDSAGKQLAAQGDNWKNVPSRAACATCHAGIDFAKGTGPTIADAEGDVAAGKALGTTVSGHGGGARADDSKCANCHDAQTIPLYHVTVDPTGANGRGGYPLNTATDTPTKGFASGQGPSIPVAAQMNLPAGVYKIDYEIKQVTVTGASGAKKVNVVYRILKDGAPVTLNKTGYLIDNVDGAPYVFVAYATTQDGIKSPADWNSSTSLYATITDLRDGKSGNSQTGPDASGYYTATLSYIIPDAATMVTGAVGINYNGFVQLGLAKYPKGIRLREPQFVMKLADGYNPRRQIVSNVKCNNCHAQLGVGPSFHSGARNNGEGCAFCHNANMATGHVGKTYSFGGGWNVGIKNLVHSIHGSAKRNQAFTYEATTANPDGFKKVTYPGVLKNCEQCHISGTYDFTAKTSSDALANLLWTTDAKGNMLNDSTTNPTGIASVGLSPWVTSLGKGQIDYTADNLVTSPIAAACFGCHDGSAAVSHMKVNGGSVYALFSKVASVATRPAVGTASTMTFTTTEACMVCHGSGKEQDIKVMHAK